MTRFVRLLLIAVLAMSVVAPAFAQSRAELAAENEALRQRVDRLEARLLTGDPAAERLMARVDTLETSIRTLLGEVERLSYERELADAEVNALESDIRILQDLSTRMKIHLDAVDLVAAQSAPTVDETYVGGPATLEQIQGPPSRRTEDFVLPPANENAANDAAQLGAVGMTRLAEGDYAGAETAFVQYLQYYSDAVDAGEINYWLGESHFVRGQYNAAAEAYVASIKSAGSRSKAPDALVKLAASLREMGQGSEACLALSSFEAQFPDASQDARDKATREASKTGC